MLENVLPSKLRANLKKAYEAHLALEEKEEDEELVEVLEQCDDVFYENEEEIIRILEEYAAKNEE